VVEGQSGRLDDHKPLAVQPGMELVTGMQAICFTDLADIFVPIRPCFFLVQQTLDRAFYRMTELTLFVIDVSFNGRHALPPHIYNSNDRTVMLTCAMGLVTVCACFYFNPTHINNQSLAKFLILCNNLQKHTHYNKAPFLCQ
jgi:hypothetical protein